MSDRISINNPWITALQGALMVIFGLAALVNPEITLQAVTRFFGAIMVIIGVLLIILTQSKKHQLHIFWMYEGIANILVGLLFLIFPQFVVNFFLVLIGLIALVAGIINLWLIIRKEVYLVALSLIRNVILIGVGILFLFTPFQGAMLIVNIIGAVALVYGILSLVMAYKLFRK